MAAPVTKPLSWEEIKEVVQRSKNDATILGKLGRNEEDLMIYRAFRAKVLNEYESMTDNLRARLFGSPLERSENGKLQVAPNDPTENEPHILVMENEFKYCLDPGISHYNIWCSSAALSDEAVETLISERIPCDEYVWFVNPPQLQSIRTIWHCHVMALHVKEGARIARPGEAERLDMSKYPLKGEGA